MSFSSDIKEKISDVASSCPQCDIYTLSGFLGNAGRVNKDAIILVTENQVVSEKIAEIINRIYKTNIKPKFFKTFYKIEIKDTWISLKMLEDTGYFKGKFKNNKPCCISAYLRGAFLGGGSITDPQKSYHLEFDYKYKSQAEKLLDLLEKSGVMARVTERKSHSVVYVKEYEMIAGVLGLIGAGGAAMEIYNISAEKEIRNEINRQMNCENANMDRIASAYCRHLKAIETLKASPEYDNLPESLREAAEIRVKFPEDSLKDLGKRFDPPIGKSGVNHRLNRLIEIADSL